MTHASAPLTAASRRRLVERCRTRPNRHVAAEKGTSRVTASKWVNATAATANSVCSTAHPHHCRFIDPNGETTENRRRSSPGGPDTWSIST